MQFNENNELNQGNPNVNQAELQDLNANQNNNKYINNQQYQNSLNMLLNNNQNQIGINNLPINNLNNH